jgi:protein tyrosine phosphatase (PTP) superfamily phosphohydrolase (DUF442 family)
MAVDLKLAGGSAPSSAGLSWLADKGYKTLVDLRESPETSAAFIAEAAQKGLRYVALPVGLKTIDAEHLARFNFELSLGEARPLYFFDSDGTRAGAFWYIRRLTVDRVATQIARREAEELGLSDQTYWLAATSYLDRHDLSRIGVSENISPDSQSPQPKSEQPRPEAAVKPSTRGPGDGQASNSEGDPLSSGEKVSAAPAGTETTAGSEVGINVPTADIALDAPPRTTTGPPAQHDAPAGDPNAWKPAAAAMVTGLSFPLAYWSRIVIPTILAKTLASLPGPARRPKSLPPASDV